MPGERRRLWALDGLRGFAALAVVAYHYLNRGPHLYAELGPAHPWLVWGQYGVQLFFIISGFVIFDSVRYSSTKRFAANRAIRLYPAYWVAVILTFTVVAVFGLPDRETSLPVGLFNLTMLAGFFNVPYVDGAYWTLAVELTFYVVIAMLARTRAFSDRWLFITLFAWLGVDLAVRAAHFLMPGNVVSEIVGGIAYWLPVFLIGIALNIGHSTGRWLLPAAVIAAAVCVVAPGDLSVVPVLIVSTLLTLGAIYVKLPDRLRPASDYLGELSYPVYLVHQNIGYVILLALASLGVPQFGAVAIAAASAIAIATVISYAFDIPVRRRLRALVAVRSR
jgi:peptidoglycan/LPS O-acetylase OafA/YrhL